MEIKKRGLVILSLFIAILALELASAEILMSQPEKFYSIGDELSIDITLKPTVNTNDFLTVDIKCNNESVEIYRNPFNLAPNEEVTINVFAVLSKSLIQSLMGESCNLLTYYGSDTAISQSFEISNVINIELELDKSKHNPGEEIEIKGLAIKKSGAFVEGFIEATIDSLVISKSSTVQNGKFSFNLTLPKEAKSGEHIINIKIYETDNTQKISNEGHISENIEISQILNKLEILLNAQNIFPGEELTYVINTYDQAGDLIQEEITLTIYEAGDFIFLNKVVNSGDKLAVTTDFSFLPGYWKIEAVAEELTARKLFYIEEVEKIQTSLINDTLIVTNIGNVPFHGPIEIAIGSSVEVKQLDLDVGETKKFRLSAPKGNYLITVNDGNEDFAFGNVLLTGNSVRIDDIREGLAGTLSQSWVWFLGILILIIIITYVNIIKKRTSKKKVSGVITKTAMSLLEEEEKTSPPIPVMYGKKDKASVIAIKLEGKTNSRYLKDTLEKMIFTAKNFGGKFYPDDNYKIILFSSTLTKAKNNEVIAVKVAKKIEEMLKDYNHKFKDKIGFGIGVNSGEIIGEKKNNEFTFTTVGNVITKAKRIANDSKGEALLSDEIRRAVINEVRTEKSEDREAWKILRILER